MTLLDLLQNAIVFVVVCTSVYVIVRKFSSEVKDPPTIKKPGKLPPAMTWEVRVRGKRVHTNLTETDRHD